MTGPNVVARVGAMLRAVATTEPDGASTTELGKLAGLARPTAHRLLTALADEHLVSRDSKTGRWSLGPELYLLGVGAAHHHDVEALRLFDVGVGDLGRASQPILVAHVIGRTRDRRVGGRHVAALGRRGRRLRRASGQPGHRAEDAGAGGTAFDRAGDYAGRRSLRRKGR